MLPMALAITRATTSAPPPGGYGTTILIIAPDCDHAAVTRCTNAADKVQAPMPAAKRKLRWTCLMVRLASFSSVPTRDGAARNQSVSECSPADGMVAAHLFWGLRHVPLVAPKPSYTNSTDAWKVLL